MKQYIPIFLLCLLLAGCAATVVPTEPSCAADAAVAVDPGLYCPGSVAEQKTGGAVRAYPLPMADGYALKIMGSSVLVFSGNRRTAITQLTGDNLCVLRQITLPFFLDADEVQVGSRGLSYYDPQNRETVVLDGRLSPCRRIPAPQDMVGTPLLSHDGSALYYCTATAIRIWDLDSGIRRVIHEASSAPHLQGLYFDDRAVLCSIPSDDGGTNSLLLSTEDGRTLWESNSLARFASLGNRYYAVLGGAMAEDLLFGTDPSAPTVLTPADLTAPGFFLPEADCAVTVYASPSQTVELTCYALSDGMRRGVVYLPDSRILDLDSDGAGFVYLLSGSDSGGCLYRWEPSAQTLTDTMVYTGPRYTAQSPDQAGLAMCRSYAQEIGSRYGLQVLIGEEAALVHPWDSQFTAEYQATILMRELERLDQRLSIYPPSVLQTSASHFGSVTISLVRSIDTVGPSESDGLQFLEGSHAYLAIAAGKESCNVLDRELFHILETHILGKSVVLDHWEQLNPPDFSYSYGYSSKHTANNAVFLQGKNHAFADDCSMTFPKEDRARIMEYAMMPGNEELFSAPYLQEKLRVLCQGIREAYGPFSAGQWLPWEQYLM